MADKNLNIKVRTKGAKRAKKELKGVSGGMASMGKAAAKAGALFFAAKGLISGFSKIIELSGKQELAEKKLATALGKTSQALLKQASALQQVSMFGDEDIIMMQSMLASFVKGEEEIKLLTKATLDLAAGMGLDLKSAGDLVAKTIGSSTNAMSRYGIEVTGAVGSTERLETLTGNVAKLFGGQALAQSKTMTGSIEQMKNAAGDAAEALGDVLAPIVIGIAKTFKGAAEWAESFIDGLNNLIKFGNVIGEIERNTKPLLEAQIAANVAIINNLTIQKRFKGGLNHLEEESLKNARFFLEKDKEKLAVLLSIEHMQKGEAERVERVKEVSAAYFAAQKKLADKAAEELEIRKKMAQFASQTTISLGTSALMGDNVTESLKRAVIQLMIMVAQAKLYDYFMTSASGGTNKISSAIVNFLFGKSPTQTSPSPNGGGSNSFLFGASPTQAAPSASAASGSKIVINNNISGFGTIDSNFASNSLIPAINKAISTGQARIG